MNASQQDRWLVYAQLAVLLTIVGVVDDVLIRVALSLVVGLLLVQRAIRARVEAASPFHQRRHDPATREAVGRLLARIREYHAVCHRAGTGQVQGHEVAARTTEIERNLNELLDEVLRASRGEQAALAAHS